MALTVEHKKKFLITMIVIMACATAINYGLYNVLNSYFNTGNETEEDTYSKVQLNMITVVIIIGVVTIIMVVLIPKENVHELMANMESSKTTVVGGGGGEEDITGLKDLDDDDDEKQLQDMIDENLGNENNKK